MKNLLFALVAVLMFASCNNAGKTKSESETKSAEVSASVCVDSFLVIAADYVGQEVTVKGTVDHVCKHGGKKVKLYSSCASKSVHGIATEAMGIFEADIEGSDICITGVVVEERMTMADIDAWEAKMEENQEVKVDADHGEGYDHHASADKIKMHREMVEKSDSGYIASYHIDVTAYNLCAVADSAAVKSKCCPEKDSVSCKDTVSKECADKSKKKEGKCCDKKEKKDCPEKK